MNNELYHRATQASVEITDAVDTVLRTLKGDETSPDLESQLHYLIDYAWSGVSDADPNWILGLLHDICVPSELLKGNLMTPAGDVLVSRETAEFVKRVANAAAARYALDEGNQVSIEMLAALANVSDRTIRTATSSSNPNAIPITKDGYRTYIEAADALEWLSARKDFVPTQRPDNRPTTTGLIRASRSGDAWKEWREAAGLTVEGLARELGWTFDQAATYQLIEFGTPDDDMLTLLPAFWHGLAAHLGSEDPVAVAALTYRQLANAYADWRVAQTN